MSPSLLGLPLAQALRHDFFAFFHFEEAASRPGSGGARVVEFRPEGGAFRELVRLDAAVTAGGAIQGLTLDLARSFIDDPRQGMFARDAAKSFLLAVCAPPEREHMEILAEEILLRRERPGPPLISHVSAPRAPSGPPSRAYEVFAGRNEFHTVNTGTTEIRLNNLRRPVSPSLEMTARFRALVDPVEQRDAEDRASPAPLPPPPPSPFFLEPDPAPSPADPARNLSDGDSMAAYHAAWTLWQGATEGDREALLDRAVSPDPAERAQAALSLGRAAVARSDGAAARGVVALSFDGARGVRLCAALAFGMIADSVPPGSVAALARLVGDGDEAVRIMAANSLRLLGPRGAAAVPALILALGDPHARYMAARALGEVGPAAREAVPPLEALARANAKAASQAAAEALRQIQGPARDA